MEKTDATAATHWKKQFNYDYLGSYSIDEGKELHLTIKSTKKEKVKDPQGKEKECFVAYFEENQKPMILNKTNCKTIAKIYGTPYIEHWKGIKVIIYATPVNAFGDTVDALRIRDTSAEVVLKEIKELFEKHKKSLDADMVERADYIIKNKEGRSYPRLLSFLKNIKNG